MPWCTKARLGADMLGEVGQKRDHIVTGFALDLVDALDLKGAALPYRARRTRGNDAELRLRVAACASISNQIRNRFSGSQMRVISGRL